jgi:hypothetical protein
LKQPQRLSEILPSLLGGHQEFLLVKLRRRRSLSMKAKLEVGDDSHPAATCGAKQRIHFVDLADHPDPT